MTDIPIYTLDIETDPFKTGRYPMPFCIGLYDGESFVYEWGDRDNYAVCIDRMRARVEQLPAGLIYAHNGGRFDVFYIMDWIVNYPMRIVNSRILSARCKAANGELHDIRDSFGIMPFALGQYKGAEKKLEIDISKLEESCREDHRAEIVEYLRLDCKVLWTLVSTFIEEYGDKLTIGTTAMGQLRNFHKFDKLGSVDDKAIRDLYFYGGRVQCFEKGIIEGNFKLYDVNSMYPFVMKTFQHPIGEPSSYSRDIQDDTFFVHVKGWNYGAFPKRNKIGSLDFTSEYGDYHVSVHEYQAAIDTGLFTLDRLCGCVNFSSSTSFTAFVDHFYNARKLAKENGDEIYPLFYKFILNSAYGKFAQNPDNYAESIICDVGTCPGVDWTPTQIKRGWDDADKYIVWERPSIGVGRFNVATGASITGAARSVLLRGIASSRRPIYCDTDSIICESLETGQHTTESELGGWKVEATCNVAAIAGKKLYALFDSGRENTSIVKMAHKGVKLTGWNIHHICEGNEILAQREAPSFGLDGKHKWIGRTVRMT